MKTNQLKKQKGFTLIELMIVVGIIGVLSAIAVPAYQSYLLKTEANAAVSVPRTLLTNIDLFIQENASFPTDAQFSKVGGAKDMSAMGTLTLAPKSGEFGTLTFELKTTKLQGNIIFTRAETGWKCTHTTAQTDLKGCAGPATGSATGSATGPTT